MFALIVEARRETDEKSQEVYQNVLNRIDAICGDEANYSPISLDHLKLAARPDLLATEVNIRVQSQSWFKKLKYFARLYALQAVGYYLMKTNKKTKNIDWSRYREDLKSNSDARKFNFSLQTIISSNVSQRLELSDYNGQHVHFVDCAEGGYAKAAQALKSRLKMLKSKGETKKD